MLPDRFAYYRLIHERYGAEHVQRLSSTGIETPRARLQRLPINKKSGRKIRIQSDGRTCGLVGFAACLAQS
jgi:hypothetical protein